MADSDLDAIRAKRMAELQSQMGGGGAGAGGGPSQEQQEEQRARQEEMKNSILSQVLDQSARARLNTISLAKPEKAKQIEGMLIQMARMGRIQEKLNESQLKNILGEISGSTQKKTRITYNRRRMDDSDED